MGFILRNVSHRNQGKVLNLVAISFSEFIWKAYFLQISFRYLVLDKWFQFAADTSFYESSTRAIWQSGEGNLLKALNISCKYLHFDALDSCRLTQQNLNVCLKYCVEK